MARCIQQAIVYCRRFPGDPVVVTFTHKAARAWNSVGSGRWSKRHSMGITCSRKRCTLPCIFNKTFFREVTADYTGKAEVTSIP